MKKKKVDAVHHGLEVDAGNTLFDKAYTRQVLKNRVRKDGLQLMSLPDVLEFKLRLNRPKDQKDIKALERKLKVKAHTRIVAGKSIKVKAHDRKSGGPAVRGDKREYNKGKYVRIRVKNPKGQHLQLHFVRANKWGYPA